MQLLRITKLYDGGDFGVMMVVLWVTLSGILSGAAIGAVIGYMIPDIAHKVVLYKCRQRGQEEPKKEISKKLRIICVTLMALFSAIVMVCNGLTVGAALFYESLFVIIFAMQALIVSLVDCKIHLIPNESVLLLLGIGIGYRFLFDGLLGLFHSLLALGVAILIFGGSSALFYFFRKRSGLGAGDIKYIFAISIVIGIEGMPYFIAGMAIAVLGYVFIGMKKGLILMTDYFPMAAHLSIGFATALLEAYVSVAMTNFAPLLQ